MEVPSMVQCSQGGALIVRSLVSGDQLVLNPNENNKQQQDVDDRDAASGGGGGDVATGMDQQNNDSNSSNGNEDQSGRNSVSLSDVPTLNHNNNNINNNFVDDDDEDNDSANLNSNNKKDDKLPQCKIKRNYSCNNCNYFTQNPRRFLMHLRDTHGERITINDCKLCLYASRHYQKLVRHMRMVHGSTEGINEPNAARRGGRGWKLGRKRNPERVVVPMDDDDELLIDEPNFIPNGIMNDGDEYKPRLEKCTLCNFTTQSRESLIAHEREDHSKTKFYRCHRCSYVTHIKARFSKHVKYHSMPMIKCEMCDFRTPYKWNLDRHMKNHGGQGPFKCSVCSFSADIKQSLTVHETNHHIPPIEHGNGSVSGETSLLAQRLSAGHDWPEDYSMSSSQEDDLPLDCTINKSPSDSDYPGETSDSPYPARKKRATAANVLPLGDFNILKNLPKDAGVNATAAVGVLNDFYMKTIQNILMFAQENNTLAHQRATSETPPIKERETPTPELNENHNKKGPTIFEKLKERLLTGGGTDDENTLECGQCNYKAKSLSDLFMHQNICRRKMAEEGSGHTQAGNLSPVLYGSTRCQFCRHRCKSTDDLLLHLKGCPQAGHQRASPREKLPSVGENSSADEAAIDNPDANMSPTWSRHNKSQMNFMDQIFFHNIEEVNENAGGNGDNKESASKTPFVSMKKVFKCPHCSFWASTASRFHVHIVGHLNRKPFECSLCSYRSNWRWDITKHIRLKTVRDANHKNARVLMNDETGRRNYTKYNKYVQLMGVNETEMGSKQSKSDDSALSPTELMPPASNSSDTSGSSRDMEALQFALNGNSSHNHNRFLAQFQQHYTAAAAAAAAAASLNSGNQHHDDSQAADLDSNSKQKTHFRCKKCSFKSYDRDEVLAHVKQHYIDAGLFMAPPSTPPMINLPLPHNQKLDLMEAPRVISNLLEIMPNITVKPSLALMPNGEPPNSTDTASSSSKSTATAHATNSLIGSAGIANLITTPQSALNSSTNSSSASAVATATGFSSLNSALNNSSNNNNATVAAVFAAASGSVSHQMQQAQQHHQQQQQLQQQLQLKSSSLINSNNNNTAPTTSTTNNNTSGGSVGTGRGQQQTGSSDWRGHSAPYRCGHCHQVSNWKHVIQRHCRLKHNGNISIEHLGKISNGESGNRRRSRFQQTSQQPSTPSLHSASILLQQQQQTSQSASQQPAQLPPSITQSSLARQLLAPPAPLQLRVIPPGLKPPAIIPLPTPEVSIIENPMSKKYKCQFCPYESNSKSQLMYHSSFHNARTLGASDEVFNCTFCTYSVTRRHLLLQHLKMHSSEAGETVDLVIDEDAPKAKLILYCRHCPARYLSQQDIETHISLHNSGLLYRCKLCSFAASTDQMLQNHVTVHSTYYQEKTREFQRKYKDSTEHPAPKVILADIASTSVDGKEQFWIVEEPDPDTQTDTKPTDGTLLFKLLQEHANFNFFTLLTHCKYCPFVADSPDDLRSHMPHHKAVSDQEFEFKCDHCDFSAPNSDSVNEHTKLHFRFINNNNSLLTGDRNTAFYTSYDKLELKCVDVKDKKLKNNQTTDESSDQDAIMKSSDSSDEEKPSSPATKSVAPQFLYSDDNVNSEKLAKLSAIDEKEKIIVKLDE